jgi:hypothetical protein
MDDAKKLRIGIKASGRPDSGTLDSLKQFEILY